MVCRPNSRSIAVCAGKGTDAGGRESLRRDGGGRSLARGAHRQAAQAREPMRKCAASTGWRTSSLLPLAPGSPFSPDLTLLWIEGMDLLGGGPVWVPFELVSTNYTLPLPPGSGCFQANTNGLASGNHSLEAISHGLCEVVERDATTLWKLQSEHVARGACNRSGDHRRSTLPVRPRDSSGGESRRSDLGHDQRRRHRELRLPPDGDRRRVCRSRVRRGLPSSATGGAAACAYRSGAGEEHLHLRRSRRLSGGSLGAFVPAPPPGGVPAAW